jgi:photosystem II stability/assembly factor-like uncharacterized protein
MAVKMVPCLQSYYTDIRPLYQLIYSSRFHARPKQIPFYYSRNARLTFLSYLFTVVIYALNYNKLSLKPLFAFFLYNDTVMIYNNIGAGLASGTVKYSLALLLGAVLHCSLNAQNKVDSVPYNWKNVQISGGGFVDGIIFHPTEKGLRYCRTDMGGAYRWNDQTKRWEPILDWVSYKENNLMGVESIALDPHNPNRVLLACGTYTSSKGPNAILRSDDRAHTFKRTDVPFRMGGNENGRGNGERLAIDPNDGNVVYMGTRRDGLWKSGDGGATWNKADNFPDITDNSPAVTTNTGRTYRPQPNGIIFVKFDPASGTEGRGSAVIYVGVSLKGRSNLFRSTDKGLSWVAIPGEPVDFMPIRSALAANGSLYITYSNSPGPNLVTSGAVYKLNTKNDEWTDITPEKPDTGAYDKFGYAGISVDAHHPQTLIVSSFNRIDKGKKASADDIYRSTDGGKTWITIFNRNGKGFFDYSLAPYVERTGIHWLFDIEIDPFNSNHAMFTTGYGGHETFNLTGADKGKPTKWTAMSTGIEETVGLDLYSPAKGPALVSAIGDYGGFVHYNLDKPVPAGNFTNPHFANTDVITGAACNPDIMVRVGESSNQVGGGNIGYTLDGGKTWQTTVATPRPDSKRGYISVSADGKSWLWIPQRSHPYITHNNGATWQLVKGLPDNLRGTAADKINPNKFYAVTLSPQKLYTSADGGNNFDQQDIKLEGETAGIGQPGGRGDARGGQDRIYCTPGIENDLWIAAFGGLYHKANTGSQFIKNTNVQQLHAFGFGKAAPGSAYPALYMVGDVNKVRGIYRSTDQGTSWVRINDDAHQWGLVLQITGDPKTYGRVYVGTHGRGIFYGDPAM